MAFFGNNLRIEDLVGGGLPIEILKIIFPTSKINMNALHLQELTDQVQPKVKFDSSLKYLIVLERYDTPSIMAK